MANKKLNLVIKIGTAALGAGNGLPDAALLGGIVAEIATLKRAGHQVLLVSSGAVGTGRALVKTNKPLKNCKGVTEKQILASLGQARLVTIYQDLLSPHGLLASQILLTKQDFRSSKHHDYMATLFAALQKQPHILPIINENDSVTIDELVSVENFTDNDELAGMLASMVKADRLIILSHIAGVYDRNPDDKNALIISLIDWKKNKNLPKATQGKSQAGRGGMQSKLAVAQKMAALGITTHIASACEPRVLTRLLGNEAIGTKVVARKTGRR